MIDSCIENAFVDRHNLKKNSFAATISPIRDDVNHGEWVFLGYAKFEMKHEVYREVAITTTPGSSMRSMLRPKIVNFLFPDPH